MLDSVLWKEPGKSGELWPFPKWIFPWLHPGERSWALPAMLPWLKSGISEQISLECPHKGVGDSVVSPLALQGSRGCSALPSFVGSGGFLFFIPG